MGSSSVNISLQNCIATARKRHRSKQVNATLECPAIAKHYASLLAHPLRFAKTHEEDRQRIAPGSEQSACSPPMRRKCCIRAV